MELSNCRYYSLADRLPALYAAVALDPDMKLKYFEIEWIEHPDWVEIAQSKSKALWESEYRSLSHSTSTPSSIQPDSSVDSQNLYPSEVGSATEASQLTSNSTLSRWKKIKRAKLTNDDLDRWDRFQGTEEVEEVEDLLAIGQLD